MKTVERGAGGGVRPGVPPGQQALLTCRVGCTLWAVWGMPLMLPPTSALLFLLLMPQLPVP